LSGPLFTVSSAALRSAAAQIAASRRVAPLRLAINRLRHFVPNHHQRRQNRRCPVDRATGAKVASVVADRTDMDNP
jgi:hypothetical protein